MDRSRTIEILNRMIAIHNRSLPMYLADARPWTQHCDEAACDALVRIVADQRALIDRLGQLVLDREGTVDSSAYSMEFTGKHDLSMRYLLPQMVQYQSTMVADIEQCVQRLEGDPQAKSAAREALGEAKGHLESLQEAVCEATTGPK